MGVFKLARISTCIILFLALAEFASADEGVRLFDANSAIEGAYDPELSMIKDIKKKDTGNWIALMNAPPVNLTTLKDEISFGLNLIIESEAVSSDPEEESIYTAPIKRLEFAGYADSTLLSAFKSGIEPGSGFEVGSDIIALRDEVSSKMDQIKSFESGFGSTW
jgi:hypothetical protein